MLFAVRQYSNLFVGGSADFNTEGRFGLDWLQKMWDNNSDPFKIFTGMGARYYDNVVAWPSTEPSDDYTALGIVLFAREVSGQ